MRILAVSDETAKQYYDYYTPGKLAQFDLILSCGDLKREYLEFLVTMAHCPLLYVRGNHDDGFVARPPEGCECIDGRFVEVGGLRIVGLGGAYRYREGDNLYSERQMRRRIRKLGKKLKRAGGFDILLTHAPARGVNDFDDLAHRGFACFTELLDRWRPRFFVHGHIHLRYAPHVPRLTQRGDTTVINACGHYIIEL